LFDSWAPLLSPIRLVIAALYGRSLRNLITSTEPLPSTQWLSTQF